MKAVFSVRNAVGMMLVLGVLFVGGCNKMSGKYSATEGGKKVMTINFKSSDKADVTVMGETHELSYEKDGNKITLHPPKGEKGDLVLMVESDGSLSAEGVAGAKLVKE